MEKWLGSPAKIKGAKEEAKIYLGCKVHDCGDLLLCIYVVFWEIGSVPEQLYEFKFSTCV